MTAKAGRAKISTTVAPETYDFFREQVSSGKARTIAEAVDRSWPTRALAEASWAFIQHVIALGWSKPPLPISTDLLLRECKRRIALLRR